MLSTRLLVIVSVPVGIVLVLPGASVALVTVTNSPMRPFPASVVPGVTRRAGPAVKVPSTVSRPLLTIVVPVLLTGPWSTSGAGPSLVRLPLPPMGLLMVREGVVPAAATLKRQVPFRVIAPAVEEMKLAPEAPLMVLLVPLPLRT